jgi:hypothetical protein
MYLNGSFSCGLTSSGWSPASDARVKRDIKPLKTSRSLERVLAAKPCTYKRIWKPTEHGNIDEKISEKNLIGFIAQEVESSNPHCLDTWDDEGNEMYSLSYNDYIIHLVGAVQEQNKTFQEQATQIATQATQIATQATKIALLQTDILTLHSALTQIINQLNSQTATSTTTT